MEIFNDIKSNFKQGNILIRLIYINVGIFVLANLVSLLFYLFTKSTLTEFYNNILAYPSSVSVLIFKPWTIITYMFMHAGLWHILFNLLWLYWFGQIFLQYLSHRQLLSVYILGGFSGALLYTLAYNLLPAFDAERFGSTMVGASAAVMAVVIGVSAIMPNYRINLLLLGSVKLKYIALVTIIIDIISIQYGNAGGHIAHLGGALFGYFFAVRYHKGFDITSGFSKFLESFFSFFKPRKRMKVSYKKPADDLKYNSYKVEQQKEMDRILDKISKSGYEGLTHEEKNFLFKSGK